MDSGRSITVAMWLMVFLQTIGSVDLPGHGERKMPSPRAYVAIMVAYGILYVLSDFPARAARRGAAMAAWIMVLAAAVLGPFGQRLVSLLNNVANFATPPPSQG